MIGHKLRCHSAFNDALENTPHFGDGEGRFTKSFSICSRWGANDGNVDFDFLSKTSDADIRDNLAFSTIRFVAVSNPGRFFNLSIKARKLT